MPVHNGERFLREAIESVLNQTYKKFEFLIIENFSTDSSLDIIKSYKDPRINIIIEDDCGQVQAYNRGFCEAKGEFVILMDQDDLSSYNRIENLLNHIENTNADITGSYFNLIDENSHICGYRELPINSTDISNELLFKNWTIFNPSVCIRKKIFEEVGYFYFEYFPSADYEFYLRIMNRYRLSNVSQYLYSWRQHANQISNKYKIEIRRKSVQISKNHLDKYKAQFTAPRYWIIRGKIYYYNNYLTKALYCLLRSLYLDSSSHENIRFLTVIVLFWFPLKLSRKYRWTNTKLFINSKNIFNKFF